MDGQQPNPKGDLTRTTLGTLFIVGLIAASLWILKPFLTALLWATMIVISTWPVLLRLQARLGGSRGLAATAFTVALLLVLIVPLGFAGGTLIGNMDGIVAWANSLKSAALPPPPEWIAGIPLAGAKISAGWQALASEGKEGLSARVAPYAGRFVEWLVGQLGGLGAMVLQFLLTVIIAAVLYVNGETAGDGVVRFFVRLAGAHGRKAALLAAGAIRGVATGVIVTAITQTAIAGAGLLICSVPGAALLISAILVLCLAQLGPILIMIPAVIWKFYSGDVVWGSVLLVFAIVSGGIDNFIRPLLIRRGADLPLLLIFAGVMGGMIGAGIMGIFIGPVILAVTQALLKEWVDNRPETPAG